MSNTAELLTVSNVAKKLKVTPQHVRSLISKEKLKADRVGAQWLVTKKRIKKLHKQLQCTYRT